LIATTWYHRLPQEAQVLAAPCVSVIIPTVRRPTLLLRALRSVFIQTYSNIEVIVVVDGPDEDTVTVLGTVSDPRIRVIVNSESRTAAGARNVGVAHATGEWVAFLDDDDEWSPDKLEKQIAFASSHKSALITCLSKVVTPFATYVWPEVIYDNSQPLDEYMFDRRNAFAGWAYFQTSSFLIPRALFVQSPFPVPSHHDDWEFILRLSKEFSIKVETVPEVLVTTHVEEQRRSLSSSGTWIASLLWLDNIKPILTPRAYSGFCLGVVGPRAAHDRAFAAFVPLLYRAFKNGSPRLWHIMAFVAFWTLPQDVRRRLRGLLRGVRPRSMPSLG
jgi:glycosyltransferase involved in cell wall biosynthesis